MTETLKSIESQIVNTCERLDIKSITVSSSVAATIKGLYSFKHAVNNDALVGEVALIGSLNDSISVYVDPLIHFGDHRVFYTKHFTLEGIDDGDLPF